MCYRGPLRPHHNIVVFGHWYLSVLLEIVVYGVIARSQHFRSWIFLTLLVRWHEGRCWD